MDELAGSEEAVRLTRHDMMALDKALAMSPTNSGGQMSFEMSEGATDGSLVLQVCHEKSTHYWLEGSSRSSRGCRVGGSHTIELICVD